MSLRPSSCVTPYPWSPCNGGAVDGMVPCAAGKSITRDSFSTIPTKTRPPRSNVPSLYGVGACACTSAPATLRQSAIPASHISSAFFLLWQRAPVGGRHRVTPPRTIPGTAQALNSTVTGFGIKRFFQASSNSCRTATRPRSPYSRVSSFTYMPTNRSALPRSSPRPN